MCHHKNYSQDQNLQFCSADISTTFHTITTFSGTRSAKSITTAGSALSVTALLARGTIGVNLALGALAICAKVAIGFQGTIVAFLFAVVAANFVGKVTDGRSEEKSFYIFEQFKPAVKVEPSVRTSGRIGVARGALHQTRCSLGSTHPEQSTI